MDIGLNIRKIREEKGLTQQQIADLLNTHRSNYSKIENGQRDISVLALDKLATYFGMSIDDIVHFSGKVPDEVTISDKSTLEQVHLLQELSEEDRSIVYKMIEALITKKRFKSFFEQNLAS